MDGVLVDSMPYHAEAWKQALAKIGINIELNDIYQLEGSNHRQIVELIFKRSGRIPDEREIKEITRNKVEIFNLIEKVRPFEGMKEILLALLPDHKLAVVSGSNRNTVYRIIDKFFPGTFHVVIDGDDTKKSKPAPDPYLKAVEKLGVLKEDCIVIENAPLGIRSARSAGIRCIAIPTYLGRERLKEADVIVENHKELIKHIQEMEKNQ